MSVELKKAVGQVLEGFTLPMAVRKILEAAYFAEAAHEPEAAPVAKNEGGKITWMIDDWPQNCLLYTHLPKRELLTDEQVEKIIKANMSLQMNLAGIRQDFEAATALRGQHDGSN